MTAYMRRMMRREDRKLMTNQATVTRGGDGGSINEQGVYTSNQGNVVYEGPCLVRAADRDVRKITFEERQSTVHIYNIQFPKETPVMELDIVTVTAADDASLVGRSFIVRDVLLTEWQISREVVCEEIR